jgi:hypothetical protein
MKFGVQFIMTALCYMIPTMILGMVWHFNLFPQTYENLGIYNRKEPIIPLGLTSMLIQGFIIAYLYPFYRNGENSIRNAVEFCLLMGLFLFSVSTLANAAKIEVASMQTWLLIQAAFHFIQFLVAGVLIGFATSKTAGR